MSAEVWRNKDMSILPELINVEGLYHEGENEIAESAQRSFWYAINMLKERFKAGEETIKKSTTYAGWYDYNLKRGKLGKDLNW